MYRKVLLLLFTMLVLLSGCKKKSRILLIGTHANYPPFEYIAGEEFRGIDIEIAQKIADKLGMEYRFENMQFEKLIPAVQNGRLDFAISAFSITPERKRIVDFSIPYYATNQLVLGRYDNHNPVFRLEDLSEYRIGGQSGTTGVQYVKDNLVDKDLMPAARLLAYSTNSEAIAAILAGNLDYLILDESAATNFTQMNSIKQVLSVDTNESYGIIMPKESDLSSRINQALQELIENGVVMQIIQNHVY